MSDWTPTPEQCDGVIARTLEFFRDECDELQQELGCPRPFIAELLTALAQTYADWTAPIWG